VVLLTGVAAAGRTQKIDLFEVSTYFCTYSAISIHPRVNITVFTGKQLSKGHRGNQVNFKKLHVGWGGKKYEIYL
jgi:hypothetical protein